MQPCFQYACSIGNDECFGEATTKKRAKETAAKKMIDILTGSYNELNTSLSSLNPSSDYFSNTSSDSISRDDSTTASTDANNPNDSFVDYTSELFIIGARNSLQIEFQFVDFTDSMYTWTCSVGDRSCVGTSNKKKHAKNMAAKAMIELLQDDLLSRDVTSTAMELPVDEVMAEYARLKSNSKDYAPVRQLKVRASHNPFVNVSAVQRARAVNILTSAHFSGTTARNKIDLVCKELKVDYDIKPIPKHPPSTREFTLKNFTHDCVLIDGVHEIEDRVLEYLKNMLNVDKIKWKP